MHVLRDRISGSVRVDISRRTLALGTNSDEDYILHMDRGHALADSFEKGGAENVTRLYRDQQMPDEQCWLRGEGWCLAHA